ncbi:MAG: uracil-DNA glycosylase, partial [Clostridia bacterium]|nr:uracil-DNA glycosylase [Clostridia bacterium]
MSDNWEILRSECESCQGCELHKTRTNCVFGVGNESADLLFVGEAPGDNEDKTGIPFVGRAGKLLDEYLNAV